MTHSPFQIRSGRSSSERACVSAPLNVRWYLPLWSAGCHGQTVSLLLVCSLGFRRIHIGPCKSFCVDGIGCENVVCS